MGIYLWRLRRSLSAARETGAARPVAKADFEGEIARWCEAMAQERRVNWAILAEPVPVRVTAPTRRR